MFQLGGSSKASYGLAFKVLEHNAHHIQLVKFLGPARFRAKAVRLHTAGRKSSGNFAATYNALPQYE